MGDGRGSSDHGSVEARNTPSEEILQQVLPTKLPLKNEKGKEVMNEVRRLISN